MLKIDKSQTKRIHELGDQSEEIILSQSRRMKGWQIQKH